MEYQIQFLNIDEHALAQVDVVGNPTEYINALLRERTEDGWQLQSTVSPWPGVLTFVWHRNRTRVDR